MEEKNIKESEIINLIKVQKNKKNRTTSTCSRKTRNL